LHAHGAARNRQVLRKSAECGRNEVARPMTRSIAAVVLATSAAGAVLFGCNGPNPFILKGDANSVEISYGGDPASALPVARDHCARYERVPRLVNAGVDLAIYDCVAATP
jgi:hypothetical protein